MEDPILEYAPVIFKVCFTVELIFMIFSVVIIIEELIYLVRYKIYNQEVRKPQEPPSVMGKTQTDFTQFSSLFPNFLPNESAENNSSTFMTDETEDANEENEFFPDIDEEADEEEIELEELFAVTKDDIRLNESSIVAREIGVLQRVRNQEKLDDEQSEVKDVVEKLSGTEFLRLFKENEERAEKRNRELLRLIEQSENPPENEHPSSNEFADDVALEDFL